MDDPKQARAYAEADFSEPNDLFIDTFADSFPDFAQGRVIDLGCGPADIPIRFARRFPVATVLGVDGSTAMVELAQRSIDGAGLKDRIAALCWRLGEPVLAQLHAAFDAVLSNSLLHHLHDPMVFWHTVKTVATPGAAVLVMDLVRPQTTGDASKIVETYAAQEPDILRRDFYNSLLAAFREDEVTAQLRACDISGLQVSRISDRHLAVGGYLS